jgi:hypothetical protein
METERAIHGGKPNDEGPDTIGKNKQRAIDRYSGAESDYYLNLTPCEWHVMSRVNPSHVQRGANALVNLLWCR